METQISHFELRSFRIIWKIPFSKSYKNEKKKNLEKSGFPPLNPTPPPSLEWFSFLCSLPSPPPPLVRPRLNETTVREYSS